MIEFRTIIDSTINVYISKLPEDLKPKGRDLFMKDLTIWLESQDYRITRDRPSPTRHPNPYKTQR